MSALGKSANVRTDGVGQNCGTQLATPVKPTSAMATWAVALDARPPAASAMVRMDELAAVKDTVQRSDPFSAALPGNRVVRAAVIISDRADPGWRTGSCRPSRASS